MFDAGPLCVVILSCERGRRRPPLHSRSDIDHDGDAVSVRGVFYSAMPGRLVLECFAFDTDLLSKEKISLTC